MNQDIDGNINSFWKEVNKVNEENVESCSIIKDQNGRLAMGEDEERRIWK